MRRPLVLKRIDGNSIRPPTDMRHRRWWHRLSNWPRWGNISHLTHFVNLIFGHQKQTFHYSLFIAHRSPKGSDIDDYRTRGKSYENVHLDKDGMYRRQYDTDHSPDDDEHYAYSYKSNETTQRSPSAAASGKKFRSENNVQYETITLRSGSATTSTDMRKRRPSSSGNEIFTEYESQGPPLQPKGGLYKKSASASLKEYKRFYGTSTEEACDDDGPKRSSDESSSSPSRTVLNSPDTVIPLLQSPMGTSSPTRRSRIPISISTHINRIQMKVVEKVIKLYLSFLEPVPRCERWQAFINVSSIGNVQRH